MGLGPQKLDRRIAAIVSRPVEQSGDGSEKARDIATCGTYRDGRQAGLEIPRSGGPLEIGAPAWGGAGARVEVLGLGGANVADALAGRLGGEAIASHRRTQGGAGEGRACCQTHKKVEASRAREATKDACALAMPVLPTCAQHVGELHASLLRAGSSVASAAPSCAAQWAKPALGEGAAHEERSRGSGRRCESCWASSP